MSHVDQPIRKAGSLAALATSVRIVSQVLSLVLLLVAGRLLTVEQFGLFALAVIAINLSATVLYSGIYSYVLKIADLPHTERTALTLHIVVGLFFAFLVLLVAGAIFFGAGYAELAKYICATAGLPLLLMVCSWKEAILLREGRVGVYYVVMLITEVVGFCTSVGCLLIGLEVWSLIIGRYVSAVLLMVSLMRLSEGFPKPGFVKEHAREIYQYSAGLYGNSLVMFFTTFGADIIIGAFLSVRAVGFFRMGSRMAGAAYDVLSQTTRVLAWQAIGRIAREGRIAEPVWVRLYVGFFMLVCIGLGTLFFVAEPLIILTLGADWLEMLPILRVICVLQIIRALDLIGAIQLSAGDDATFLFRARLVEITILLVSVLFAVQFGGLAVAFGLLPSAIVMFLMQFTRLKSRTGISTGYVLGQLLPGVCVAAVTVSVVALAQGLLADRMPIVQVLGAGGAGLVAMSLVLFVVLRSWVIELSRDISLAILPRANGDETVEIS